MENAIMSQLLKVRYLLLLSLLVLISRPSFAASLADVIERVSPSVVGVGTSYPPRQPIGAERPNQLLGTGFAVGDGQFIVTNHHVLPELLDLENKQVLAVFSGRGDDAVVRPAVL
ncbi:MAG TPA: hypothetical protein VIC02_02640, partial [Kineobactrum sp.]